MSEREEWMCWPRKAEDKVYQDEVPLYEMWLCQQNNLFWGTRNPNFKIY